MDECHSIKHYSQNDYLFMIEFSLIQFKSKQRGQDTGRNSEWATIADLQCYSEFKVVGMFP